MTLVLPESITSTDIKRVDILVGQDCDLSQMAIQEGITKRSAREWLRRLFVKFGKTRNNGRPANRMSESGEIVRGSRVSDLKRMWIGE